MSNPGARAAHGLVAVSLLIVLAGETAGAQPSAADREAIYKAAGFKSKGSQFVRCDDPAASYSPGQIAMEDLNADGVAEAKVVEGSSFCYGNTGTGFVLLTKDARGAWRVVLDQPGIPLTQKTRTNGWLDIEVGGPGLRQFPVYRFDGKAYAAGRPAGGPRRTP